MGYVRRAFPEKSWSVSRHLTLDECARKYYYHYYASHNGWEREAPEPARLAYRLKQLTNLYLALGEAVHQAAAAAFRRVQDGLPPPDAKEIKEAVRAMLNDTYRRSKNNRDQFIKRPRRHPMLHEMYYGHGPSDRLIDTIKDRLDVCVRSLQASRTFQEACASRPQDILAIDRIDSFLLDGTKVYAVPDLVYRRADGTWVIADWKTGGKTDDHMDQVWVYALYAREKLDLPLSHLAVRLEYLLTGEAVEVQAVADDLARIKQQIGTSMDRMGDYLADPDANEPLDREAFPLRTDTRNCRFCNFFALCEDQLDLNTGPDPAAHVL